MVELYFFYDKDIFRSQIARKSKLNLKQSLSSNNLKVAFLH